MHNEFRPGGVITSLITPFKDGEIDTVGWMALLECQIRNGIDGILLCGTTGEGWAIYAMERERLISLAVDVAENRVPVIVAVGSNNTEAAIGLSRQAARLGANAVLVTVPFYNKPTQAGILHHFGAVAANGGLPVIVENAPARTAVDLTPASIACLADIPGIAALADASGDITRIAALPSAVRDRLPILSAHDDTALAFTIAGGCGVLSALANIAPRLTVSAYRAAASGQLDAALNIDDRLAPLRQALQREPLAATLKYALMLLRGLECDTRLPLTAIEPETTIALRIALAPFLEAAEATNRPGPLARLDI